MRQRGLEFQWPAMHRFKNRLRASRRARGLFGKIRPSYRRAALGSSQDNADITPLPEAGKVEQMKAYIDEALEAGAKVINTRGGNVDGNMLFPAIVFYSRKTALFHEEQFGPVCPVVEFEDFEEVLADITREPIRTTSKYFHHKCCTSGNMHRSVGQPGLPHQLECRMSTRPRLFAFYRKKRQCREHTQCQGSIALIQHPYVGGMQHGQKTTSVGGCDRWRTFII